MTLIAIIVALLAERVLGHLPVMGSLHLVRGYLAVLRRALPVPAVWRGWLAVPVVVAPPVLLTLWVQRGIYSPVLGMIVSGAVLFLCLGPRDLADDVKRWLAARRAGDRPSADRLARLLQQGPAWHETDEAPESRNLVGALFIQSHERVFGSLLWFLAFGAAGAVFYRLVSRLPRLLIEDEDLAAASAADTVHACAAWVPARLTAVLFALAGSMDDAMKEYGRLRRQPSHGWRHDTWAVLAEVGSGSLEYESPDGFTEVPATVELAAHEVVNLQLRALGILLAVIAILVIGDWFG
ncbi:MAG: regulatory signaling modulator protein AmpE [Panacagrimonas sp.]